jgi:hypothetical protein
VLESRIGIEDSIIEVQLEKVYSESMLTEKSEYFQPLIFGL